MYVSNIGLLKLLSPGDLMELRKAIDDELAVRVIEGIEPNTAEANLWQRDQKLLAIKELRRRTGCGLKEAKDAMENWAALNSVNPQGKTS